MPFLADTDEETFEDLEAEFDEDIDEEESEGMWRPSGGIRGRSELHPVVTSSGEGVSQALISTPQGQARVQLSRSVVSHRNFDGVVGALRTGLNRNTSRLNELQRDVKAWSDRIAGSTYRNHRQLRKLRSDAAKYQKANTTALAKASKAQQQQMMTVVLLTLLRDSQHHRGGRSNDDNLVLVLLLTMMGGYGGGEGGGDNMMMLLLVLILTGGLGGGHHHHNGGGDNNGDGQGK